MDPSARPHRRRTRVATALVATLALAAALAALPASSRAYGQPADSTNSQAASAAQDQTGAQTVKVGWLLDNQGFQSGTPGEYQSGWGYEYLQTLSYYAPAWRYEYVTGTFSELMDKLEAGEIDLMPNISYTEERAQKLLFSSNPEGTEHYYIYAKPGRADLATGDPNALNGLTIGCNQGVMQTEVGQQWIADKGVTCDYRYYATGNELFSALADDEVDAIIMNDTLSSGDAMPMFSVGESNYYFVVPKSRQGLMDQINEAMTSLRSTNPRYNDEVKTHYSTDGSGSSSLTAKEGAWLDARGGQITLGYLSGVLPFSDKGADGELDGSLTAVADELESRFGATVSTRAYSSNDDMEKALQSGEIDAAMPVAKDYWLAEQDNSAQSSTLCSTSLIAVYAGDDLQGALGSIATCPSSLFNANLVSVRYPQAQVQRHADAAACVGAVKRGDASCVIIPANALDTLRDETDLTGLKTAELPEGIELACWMRQGSPELLGIMNKAIANAGEKIVAGNYSHYSYTGGQSDLAKFLHTYQTPLAVGIVALLGAVVAVLARSLRRARDAQAKAVAASAAKSAFLSRMSHDIRTPLNGIIGLIEVNDLHAGDAELTSKNRAKAKVAADHLLTLINDILEMSKIEDRAIVLEHKSFNLTELFHDAFVLGSIRAADHGVTVQTDGGENLRFPDVYGSPTHVRQVVLNIVDNCVKYNKPGGSVSCSESIVDIDGDRVTYRFVIEDTGIGMSKEFLKHIFEPFAQAGTDARSTYQGTGMGMPIVKALTEAMGGTIEVQSELGVGSTFILTLPFEIDRDPAAHRAKLPAPKGLSIEGMSILLAEDNELNAEIARELLRNEGAEVTRVANGEEAVEAFRSKPAGTFDAILMDIMMPKMDGYEASRAIRRSDRRDAAGIPIVAMTANAFLEDVRAAREAGMNGHIAKPISVERLREVLAQYR